VKVIDAVLKINNHIQESQATNNKRHLHCCKPVFSSFLGSPTSAAPLFQLRAHRGAMLLRMRGLSETLALKKNKQ